MTNWDEYVRHFYSLPPAVQQAEWAKLTAEQRAQFEAARSSLSSLAPPPAPSAGSTKRLMVGCAIVALVATCALIGISILGRVGRQSQPAVEPQPTPTPVLTVAAAAAEIDSVLNDKEHSIATLRKVRDLIERFPNSPEAQRFSKELPDLERRAEKQQRQQEAERVRASEEQRIRLAAAKWSYDETSDEMTSRKTHTAAIRSENSVNFDFPYGGEQRATLLLRTHPSYGRDVIFSIEKGQLLCHTFDRCKVRIRFDDKEPQTWSGSPPADNSTTSIFLPSYDRFLQQMRRAKVVRIQPEVYQQGIPSLSFRSKATTTRAMWGNSSRA